MKLIYWNNNAEDRDEPKPTIAMPQLGADQVQEVENAGGFVCRTSGTYALAETLPDVTLEDLDNE
jgi:hypothetical protein